METPWDDQVAQYLIGRSRVTLDQVCSGIGIEYASSYQHDEIARAMENIMQHPAMAASASGKRVQNH